MLELDRHLPLCVLAHRHRLHPVVAAHRRHAGQLLDRQEDRIHGAVAGCDRHVLRFAGVRHPEGHRRRSARLAGERIALIRILLRQGGEPLLAEGGDVAVVNLLLAVGEQLELVEHGLELLGVEFVAKGLGPVGERRPAAVLAEHEVGLLESHVFRPHDLVGAPLLEHPVLVDARLVGEGVPPHDRLVPWHLDAGDCGHEPAGRHELAGLDPRRTAEVVGPRPQRHHNLLERTVACPLADPVDRALDLAGSRLHRRQAVGHRQAEVVVAVDADHGLVDVRHTITEARDHMPHLAGGRVADGVGDVDGGRAGRDRRLDHAAEKIDLGAGGILRGELDIVAEVAGPRHTGHGPSHDLVFRHP